MVRRTFRQQPSCASRSLWMPQFHGDRIAGNSIYDVASRTLTFTPSEPLLCARRYLVNLNADRSDRCSGFFEFWTAARGPTIRLYLSLPAARRSAGDIPAHREPLRRPVGGRFFDAQRAGGCGGNRQPGDREGRHALNVNDRDVLQLRDNDSLHFKTREAVHEEEERREREQAGAAVPGVACIIWRWNQCPSPRDRTKVCSRLDSWGCRASPTASSSKRCFAACNLHVLPASVCLFVCVCICECDCACVCMCVC